jgi:hypothetical protein
MVIWSARIVVGSKVLDCVKSEVTGTPGKAGDLVC